MRVEKSFGRWLLAASLALAFFSPMAGAAEGRIFYASGGAYIERGTARVDAQKDVLIESGDVLVTEEDGRLQWRMADDAYFAMRPNSRYKIAEYQAPAVGGTGGKAFYEMLAGGFRNLTGLIGKQDKASYRVATPVATLGIRGTDYTSVLCNNNCQWAERGGNKIKNGLYIRVDVGSVLLSNPAGSLEVKAGQYAYVENENTVPILLTEALGVFVNWTEDFEFRFSYGHQLEHIRIEPGDVPGIIPSPN